MYWRTFYNYKTKEKKTSSIFLCYIEAYSLWDCVENVTRWKSSLIIQNVFFQGEPKLPANGTHNTHRSWNNLVRLFSCTMSGSGELGFPINKLGRKRFWIGHHLELWGSLGSLSGKKLQELSSISMVLSSATLPNMSIKYKHANIGQSTGT